MKVISLIVPVFNEEASLPIFIPEVMGVMASIEGRFGYELLLIDDGSKDDTLKVIRDFAQKYPCIRYIAFSRNFGKESAIYAGFCNAKGDYVAVMDADMQDPPSLLPQMIEWLETEQYDSVATRRIDRNGEPLIRSFFAKIFYRLINAISDVDIVDGARDFRLMKREMAEAIVCMGEYDRFSKGIFGWIGFRTYWLPYENVERVAGQTKWNFWGLFKYAVDGIINFSQVPLSLASGFGIGMTISSLVTLIVIIIRRSLFGDPAAGWASLICVMIFIGGIQLLCLGIIGKYMAKTYLETKKRPHYIVAETNDEAVERVR